MASSNEVRDRYVAQMGPELGEFFHAISNDLTWLHWRWRQYRVLFGDKPERLELLNDAAPLFFRIIQDVLFEDTLLGIARLVGPHTSMGHPQLSVHRLHLLVPGPPRPAAEIGLWGELHDLIARSKSAAAFAEDWRNNRIAHRNLGLALGRPLAPLSAASRELVEAALEALRNVLNHVQSSYSKPPTTTAYDGSPLTWDAETLLYVLRDGRRLAREREDRWARGEMDEDDLHPPPSI